MRTLITIATGLVLSASASACAEGELPRGAPLTSNATSMQPDAPMLVCAHAYPDLCIPPPPASVSCSTLPKRDFRVLPPDPHGLDGDHDGVGCES